MNIKSPQSYYRDVFTAAGIDLDTYMTAIAHGTLLLKGDGSSLQDDFRNWVYTPATSFSRDSNGVPTISAGSASALDQGTNRSYAASTDLIFLNVGQVDPDETLGLADIIGNAAGNGVINATWTTNGVTFKDDLGGSSVVAASASFADEKAGLAGVNICKISSLDADNGTSGNSTAEFRIHNIDSDTEVATGTKSNIDAGGAYTPNTNVWITGWDKYMGSVLFAFPSNGLPATWEADMKALAAEIVARRT